MQFTHCIKLDYVVDSYSTLDLGIYILTEYLNFIHAYLKPFSLYSHCIVMST